MKLYPDCDYFGDRRDDPLGPQDSEDCTFCMRYDLCKKNYEREQRKKEMI